VLTAAPSYGSLPFACRTWRSPLPRNIVSAPTLATLDPRFFEPLQHDLFETDFARSQEWTEAQPLCWNDYIANQL
jgi:hypothetical protein